ncbi:MAG: ATPase, partial [Bacteroidetes bacterium]
MSKLKDKPIGLTRDVGFQVGARKTFAVSLEKAWDFLVSENGTRLWLDEIDIDKIELKTEFSTPNGFTGKITVFKPYSHLRMQWRHPDWENTSTLQIRTIPNKNKTIISFHQEKLSGIE